MNFIKKRERERERNTVGCFWSFLFLNKIERTVSFLLVILKKIFHQLMSKMWHILFNICQLQNSNFLREMDLTLLKNSILWWIGVGERKKEEKKRKKDKKKKWKRWICSLIMEYLRYEKNCKTSQDMKL